MYHISSSHLEGARAGESEGGETPSRCQAECCRASVPEAAAADNARTFRASVMRDALSPEPALATATETCWI